jgi:hypothetical protein
VRFFQKPFGHPWPYGGDLGDFFEDLALEGEIRRPSPDLGRAIRPLPEEIA